MILTKLKSFIQKETSRNQMLQLQVVCSVLGVQQLARCSGFKRVFTIPLKKQNKWRLQNLERRLYCLNNILLEVEMKFTDCILYCDSLNEISLAHNIVFHGRTKDIQMRYHLFGEFISDST